MNEYENDVAPISTEQEGAELDTANEDKVIEDTTDWKAKAEKAEEIAENQRIRAEKAEGKLKSVKTEVAPKETPKTAGDITTKDLYALMEAKVAEEDIDEVARYAKFQNISIAEALKSNVVKTILSDKIEQRKTASAANVGSTKRGTNSTPDEVLLSKAAKGELPENDADLERLIKLRKGIK